MLQTQSICSLLSSSVISRGGCDKFKTLSTFLILARNRFLPIVSPKRSITAVLGTFTTEKSLGEGGIPKYCVLQGAGIKGNKMSEEVSQQGSSSNEDDVAGDNGEGDRSKCVFCRIVDGKEQNDIYYQDDEIVVFQDIKPASKHHLLVVTREHIRDSKSLLPNHLGLLDRLVQTGHKVLLEQIQQQSPDTTNLDDIRKLLGFHWPPFHTISHLHLHCIAPTDQMGFIARTIFRPNSFWFVTPEYVKERLEKMSGQSGDKSNGSSGE